MTEPELISRPGAALSLYRDAPSWDGLRCAAIGGLRFEDRQAADALLQEILAFLRAESFVGVLGPMDGDT